MTASKEKVVTIHYTLTSDDGQLIESSEDGEPLAYLHGANNIVGGLERALDGKAAGQKVRVTVEPSEGYGEFDEDLRLEVPKEQLEDLGELEVGLQFRSEDEDGGVELFTVVEVGDSSVTIDANHPLAGEKLCFDVEIVDVRPATPEELAHGHAHGADGHGTH